MGEGSGVTLAPLGPIRVTLGSHGVPSALSGGHTMSPGSGTAAAQTHSRAGVWTGVQHPHPEEFLRNLHPCSATAAPAQALFLHPCPTGISPSQNPTPQIHPALPKLYSQTLLALGSPHSKTQPFKTVSSPSNPSHTSHPLFPPLFPIGLSPSSNPSRPGHPFIPSGSPHPRSFPP